MNVKKLQLINFRNYESETFLYSDGVNVVSGGLFASGGQR